MTRLPVTAAAEGILLGQRLDASYTGYWTAECAEITGPVDVARLARSVTATVRDAEALHARFDGDGQLIVATDWECEVVRLAETGPDAWPRVRAEIDRDLARPVDLAAGGLFAATLYVADDRVFWYIRAHHVVLDGFGYALLYRQVSQRYRGRDPQPFGRLADLVADDVGYRDGAQAAVDRDYWVRRLSGARIGGFTEATALPDHEVLGIDLPGDLVTDAGPRWPHRLVALVAAALHRRGGAEVPILGLPVSGRLGTIAARTPAMVMNIVPVPVPITLDDTVDDVAATVEAQLRESRPHQRYRYEWLRGDVDLPAGRGRVFGPVVNIIPFAEPPRFAGNRVRMHHLSAGPVDDLAITARGPDQVTLTANPRLYSIGDLESIREELSRLAAERGRVSPWRELPAAPAPEVRPLPELVAEHDPETVAVVAAGVSVSYGQLRRRAEAVATALAARGVTPGELVAVSLPRGVDAIVAMVGVLYAGAGYLPLDARGATERNAAILAEAAPRLVIDADFAPLFAVAAPKAPRAAGGRGREPSRAHGPRSAGESVKADTLAVRGAGGRAADDRLTATADGDLGPTEDRRPAERGRGEGRRDWRAADPAYVIYTSGSTGRPKGVVVPRSALDFFVATATRRYGLSADDRVLQFAPLHFDAHVEEVFAALAVGATIVVRDDSATESLSRFAEFLATQRVTVLDLPTAYWHELVLALERGQFALPESVVTVIIGGEAAIPERVAQWHAAVGNTVRLVNSYGPTEATVVCLAADLAPGEPVSLGAPLAGVRAAVGPADELYVAGPGLASGYLDGSGNRITAERPVSPAVAAATTPSTGGCGAEPSSGTTASAGQTVAEAKPSTEDHGTAPSPAASPSARLAGTVPSGDSRGVEASPNATALAPPSAVAESVGSSARPGPARGDGGPFVVVDGQRWYRTGDLVAVTDSGDLDYRGRRDTELKISGHRVHPAEVEAALLRHPAVREVVVTVERSPRTRLSAHVATDLDAAALREHARAHLIAAAIPTSMHILDRLPRTSTGKLDRRGLTTATAPVAEPATAAERTVLALLAEALGQRLGANDDFFAVGGTSLSAIAAASRLSAAFEREVTAAQLFAHPSAAELAAVLTGEAAGVDEDALVRADRVWRHDTDPCLSNGDDAVTLTGATGFVGAHLLEALLVDTDRPIRCLVRGGRARLAEAARRFGLPEPEPGRVTVIDCDLSRPVLGLDATAMALVSDSRAIVNCAANVSFSRGYAGLRAVNVEAVRTLLELAFVGGAAFHQVSTVSVGGGRRLPEDFIAEHPGLVDGYQLSKWVAEDLLRQAARQGLPVSVYRLGRVVPPLGACAHNPEDFVAHLIRASLALGATPRLSATEPWIAADVAADCVVDGVGGGSTGVWNLSGGAVSLSAVWRRLHRDRPDLESLPVAQWRRRLGDGVDTAILKSFFDLHADGPPPEHDISAGRFADWFAGAPRPGPAWNLDWCALVGR